MSTAYYAYSYGGPSPDEWNGMADNSLSLKPYGILAKINLTNITSLCPVYAPYITNANAKLFAFLPRCINGGFIYCNGGQETPVFDLNYYSETPDFTKDPCTVSLGVGRNFLSGMGGWGFERDITGLTSMTVSGEQPNSRVSPCSPWFAYGLASYDSINVTSLKKKVKNYYPGCFSWNVQDPVATGIVIPDWEDIRDYLYPSYLRNSRVPELACFAAGSNPQNEVGVPKWIKKDFSPMFFRVSFRGIKDQVKSGSNWVAQGFGNNHTLSIYIHNETGELYLYFYTRQMGGITDMESHSYIPSGAEYWYQETTAINEPMRVLNFLMNCNPKIYSVYGLPREMLHPNSIVWKASESLDLNSVIYDYDTFVAAPMETYSARTIPTYSAPKEMQDYLPMVGLSCSADITPPLPNNSNPQGGYIFSGTWNTTASTWS